jgi:putative ABC transport system permease protein
VLLKEGVDVKNLESKFPSVFRTLLGEENYIQSKYTVGLQPLTDIHLNTSFPIGVAPVSNPRYAYILSAVAFLILFVACINFVTLSVGRSIKRAKEVGIRKVVGAGRQQLIFQFIGEAVIITVISLTVGVLLAFVNLGLFNQLSGKNLSLGVDGFTILVAFSLITIIGLFAGSYPAFVLSGFRPVTILKGSVQVVSSRQWLRKVLVGFQLILSIFLISSTIIMRNQLTFLQNKNLGFDKEQMAVVQLNIPRGARLAERVKIGFEKVQQFKIELQKIPDVAGVCGSSHDFGNGNWTNVGYTDDKGTYRNFNMNVIEPDYFSVLKMDFADGRNFDVNNPSDARRGVVINEAFAKELGWKNPVGMKIPGKDFPDHEVIGVVKDFNYTSLYTKVPPLALVMDAGIILTGIENINIDNSPLPKLLIRLKPGNMSLTIDQIKGVWNQLTGGDEFAFNFIDQALDAQYRNDQNLGKIISIATLLAMIIGSLGLYGLASLSMQNRTKEISIRKVLGATEQSLLVLLSKEYVLIVVVSLFLSVPITWYLMSQWLQSFEYRVAIGWSSFVLAGGISLLIALLTISYQTIKTASAQPAETLKYE